MRRAPAPLGAGACTAVPHGARSRDALGGRGRAPLPHARSAVRRRVDARRRLGVRAPRHLHGECVLLHQDFHRGNVLRAEREPWLAIDPKPLAGERAFDARWLLRDLLYREPRIALPVPDLLERLAAELALDAERVRLWTLARAVENALWCYEIDDDAADDLALASALL